jgi:ferric-dicitrate binding protein FerR (iron transport regulator)
MNTKNQTNRSILEQATEAVRLSEPPAAEAKAAAERVWQKLEGELPADVAVESGVVYDCADFLGMFVAYRAGTLAAARRELFEDHTRSCVSCRRALWQATGRTTTEERPALGGFVGWRRWALAAAAVLVAAIGVKVGVLDRMAPSGDQTSMVAERVNGSLFRVHDGTLVPIEPNQKIAASETIRTGRGSRAILHLSDGSRVEMNEHSELGLEPRRDGTAIALRRGGVIVEAAKQAPDRHLYVDAPDCEVAVKGTVFTVSHGPKGSRVSVLEGEVWVEQGGGVTTKLEPGQQTATQPNIAPVVLAEEVAWSCEPERYNALLHELAEVSKQMMAKLANVPLRYESKLVSALPADTFIVAAVPNIASELAGAGEDLLRRIAANPQLADWFAQQRAANPNAPDMIEVLTRFRELGSFCGAEVVIAVAGNAAETHPSMLLLAEVRDEAGMRAAIAEDLKRLGSASGHEIPVILVDNPAAIPQATGDALYVLVSGGLAVASNSTTEIVRMAAAGLGSSSAFASTPFYAQLARCYKDGVTWLFAANLEQLTKAHETSTADSERRMSEDLGLTDAQYVIFEHKRINSQSQLRGVVAFARDRRGVPSWLGAPAPMGALEFVSPNAYAVGCLVAKEPKEIANDVLGAIERNDPDGFGKLAEFERTHGLSVREDLAAPLGGEFLFAIDGPILPKPAWKVVVSVEDQPRLQGTIVKLLTEANAKLAAENKPTLVLTESSEGGLPFYTIAASDQSFEVYYTFWDGYMVIAGSRLMLTDALATRKSGLTLSASAEFRGSLPVDGQEQYSALVFVNASTLGSAIASAIPTTASPQSHVGLGELKQLLTEARTMSFCVTAEHDRILVTSTGLDLLNPSRMLEGLAKIGEAHTHSQPKQLS